MPEYHKKYLPGSYIGCALWVSPLICSILQIELPKNLGVYLRDGGQVLAGASFLLNYYTSNSRDKRMYNWPQDIMGYWIILSAVIWYFHGVLNVYSVILTAMATFLLIGRYVACKREWQHNTYRHHQA